MSTVEKFEDLLAWQRARELVNFVYEISKSRDFASDRGLVNQITRAAVSVMSNIAEGFDRATQNEFVDALFIAKGEAGEVRSQLYIAHDLRYIDISKFQYGLKLTDECSRLIQSFAQKVKVGSRRGLQFKHIKKPDNLGFNPDEFGLIRLPDGSFISKDEGV
jgi:four helix bundle protein